MRLLHPTTLKIAAERSDIPKTVISHVWAEVFKFVKSGQKHPKMFIKDERDLGIYLSIVYRLGIDKGCNLDISKVKTLTKSIKHGFDSGMCSWLKDSISMTAGLYFDSNYLFSDACSLYFKGINIFPDIFGDEWRKYIPIESHKEILRQVTKTINK